ncbi:MAG: PDZ domain-containing protein [Planctomycetes bacterium]|nr:PDZ domain-containing protein [Planctomycetota bacterium]
MGMARWFGVAAVLVAVGDCSADELGDQIRAAATRHSASVVRVEAVTSVAVERLPGLPPGARRTQRIGATGAVVDAQGLVVFPAAALDPAGAAFALLGSRQVPDVLSLNVRGLDGRVRPARWLGRVGDSGLAFARLEGAARDGLAPLAFAKASPRLGDVLLVLSVDAPSGGAPRPRVEVVRVAREGEGALLVSPTQGPTGALALLPGGEPVGILAAAAVQGGAGDLLRPDRLAELRRAEVFLASRLAGPIASPPNEAPVKRTRTRPWLGTRHQQLTPELAASLKLEEEGGVRILEVYPDGPAAKAKLAAGDVLVEMDGEPLDLDPGEIFDAIVEAYRIGDELEFTVVRGGDELQVVVTLSEGPVRPPHATRRGVQDLGLQLREVTFYDRKELALNPAAKVADPDSLAGGIVVDLDPDGAASLAGLRGDDLITHVDGQKLANLEDGVSRLTAAGNHEVQILRHGKPLTLTIRR